MKRNFDKIFGTVSLLFGVIFVGLIFLEVSKTIHLVISILYFIFAVISLFFHVRQKSVQKVQGQDKKSEIADTQENGTG